MVLMLHNLMNPVSLSDEIEAGFVREQMHPDDATLRILNYTHKAQYDRRWNDVTRQCRGLIHRDGLVLARPWPKFYNYGEHEEGSLDLSAPAVVTDKMDGSLGILYPAPDGLWAIATRGSFTSDQAVHATGVLREKHPGFEPLPGHTYLFEIIYPENRVVLDYGGLDDLVLLDVLDTESGYSCPSRDLAAKYGDGPGGWHGRRVRAMPAHTLGEAMAIPPRPNAEGVVARVLTDDGPVMVKFKQEDYVALHRLVTGLTDRRVHELMADDPMDDGPIHELCAAIPDEFAGWVWQVVTGLRTQLLARHLEAAAAHHDVMAELGRRALLGQGGFTRKAYALEAQKDERNCALMFSLLDGRDPTRAIWRDLRPSGVSSLVDQKEETA
jgi:RNA ligase